MSDDLHYEASPDETASYKQVALDLLYNLGCQYDIKTKDMQQLCSLALVRYDDFLKYSGKEAVCQ